jgi:hypothetical protein
MNDPISHMEVKKLSKFLKIDNIINSIEEYIEIPEGNKQIENESKKTFYHGTSINKIKTILKYGLEANRPSNFDMVDTTGKVFITTNKSYAIFYSLLSSERDKSLPVIIEIKGLDADKLVPDFDIYHRTSTREWERDERYEKNLKLNAYSPEIESRSPSSATRESKNYGVFGYVGKILPQKFTRFFLFDHITEEEVSSLMLDRYLRRDPTEPYTKSDILKYIDIVDRIAEYFDISELYIYGLSLTSLENVLFDITQDLEEEEEEEAYG